MSVALLAISALSAPALVGTINAGTPSKTVTQPALLSDTALIMGGTGMPDPTPEMIDLVNDIYIRPYFPGYAPVGLHTPEEAWPLFGTMTGEQSVAAGVRDLHTAITDTYAGDNLLIFGVSQSALIAGLEMRDLIAHPPADLATLHFALLGGPDNPMGGIFLRLNGLSIPGMNFSDYPPTITDAFPTAIYAGEYDGVSDFPRYPFNIWALLNAIAGLQTVHLGYADLTAEQVASAVHLGHTGLTDFYMIPTPILPLLQPLYESSDVGKMLVDYIQPQLKVLVDLGYGNLQHGLVPDPGGLDGAGLIGFIPKMDPLAVLAALQLAQIEGTVSLANDLLGHNGLPALPDFVTDILKSASGYDATVALDQAMLSGLTQLSKLPDLAQLNPDTLFDGLPLIDGTQFIDEVNRQISDMLWWLPSWLLS